MGTHNICLYKENQKKSDWSLCWSHIKNQRSREIKTKSYPATGGVGEHYVLGADTVSVGIVVRIVSCVHNIFSELVDFNLTCIDMSLAYALELKSTGFKLIVSLGTGNTIILFLPKLVLHVAFSS